MGRVAATTCGTASVVEAFRRYNLGMSCDHRTHFIEMRDERSAIMCDACGTQLAGWRIEVRLPFFVLEQADELHAMWHLSQERGEATTQEEACESAWKPPSG